MYDAPNPEAIRRAAERNGLPVDRITRVTVLDPYFYTPSTRAELPPRERELGRATAAHRSLDR